MHRLAVKITEHMIVRAHSSIMLAEVFWEFEATHFKVPRLRDTALDSRCWISSHQQDMPAASYACTY